MLAFLCKDASHYEGWLIMLELTYYIEMSLLLLSDSPMIPFLLPNPLPK